MGFKGFVFFSLAIMFAGPSVMAMPSGVPGNCVNELLKIYSTPSVAASRIMAFFNVTPEELGLIAEFKENGWLAAVPVETVIALIKEKAPDKYVKGMNQLLHIYFEFSKERGVTPQISDLNAILARHSSGINIADLIGDGLALKNLDDLHTKALDRHPTIKNALNSSYSSPEIRAKIEAAIKSAEVIYVTSAVNGAPVEREALEALLNMAKLNKGVVLIRPVNLSTDALDPLLREAANQNPNVFISIDEIRLNQWWNINDIKVMGKQINTLQGTQARWERGVNQIISAPRIELETVATGDNVITPHRVMTTGAITQPDYRGNKWIQGRTDKLAKDLHSIGVLVLEKTQFDGKTFGLPVSGNFHPRHIQYTSEAKGFVDLGVLYTGTSAKSISIEALVLGDIHVQDTDPRLLISIREAIDRFHPKIIVAHDLMNGTSVNPHEKDQKASLMNKASQGLLDVVRELSQVANFINALLELDPSLQVLIVRSNHPDWLGRWVEGSYLQSPQNQAIYNELQNLKAQGGDVFEYALVHGVGGSVTINKYKRVIFSRGSYKVGPAGNQIELGFHGDKGANGAKGSIQSFARGLERVVYGHTHTTRIKEGAINVGTSTTLELPYMIGGLSSWSQSMLLVGNYGDAQMIINEGGELYAPESYKPNVNFFMKSYPKIIPTIQPRDAGPGQIDQYSR